MLKRSFFCFVIVCSLFSVTISQAAWKDVYTQVSEAYVGKVSVENLAVAALKGLHNIDKEVTVANDSSYVTLYYKGKVAEALRKPREKNDAAAWGTLTEKIVARAAEVSALASEKDFKTEDVLAEAMVSVLDKDSKFYASMDDAVDFRARNHRVFAARAEGDLLYIKIKAFNKQTVKELINALSKFLWAKAIVVDLRGCP